MAARIELAFANEAEEREKQAQLQAMDELMTLLDEKKFKTMDLFAALDTDKSGAIDQRELHVTLNAMGLKVTKRQTAAFFAELDVDRDGDVTIAEFLQRMRKLQLSRRAAAKAEARRLQAEMRKMGGREAERAAETKAKLESFDKLGRVDERPRSAQADAALVRIINYIEENKLKMVNVFNQMDADDSGFIDKYELQTTMKELGLDLTLDEAEQVCADLDIDGDSTVERAEFFKRCEHAHTHTPAPQLDFQGYLSDILPVLMQTRFCSVRNARRPGACSCVRRALTPSGRWIPTQISS